MPSIANVFLANKPIEVNPVNATRPVLEMPLQMGGGPILESVFDHPLGSNIQHILEDLDLKSKDLVGM